MGFTFSPIKDYYFSASFADLVTASKNTRLIHRSYERSLLQNIIQYFFITLNTIYENDKRFNKF